MATTVVEELALAFSVDVEGLKKGLSEVAKQLGLAKASVEDVAGGTSEAMSGVASATADAADKAGGAVKKLGKESEKTGKKGTKAFGEMGKALKKLRENILPLVGALTAAFGSAKLFNEYVSQGNSLKELSRRTGMSIADLDAWGKATEAAGGKAGALFSTLEQWYQKTGKPAEAFLRFGEMVDGMAEKDAQRLLRLYGVAEDAIPIFLKGQAEAQRLYTRYRETAFTQQDADNARAFKVAWMDFGIAAQSVGNLFLRTVVPALTKVLQLITDGVDWLRENIRFVSLLASALGILFGAKTIKAAGGLLAIVRSLGLAFKVALLPVLAIGAAIAALALAIDDLMTFVEGGDSLFERTLKSLGLTTEQIEDIREAFSALGDVIGGLYDLFAPFVKGLLKGFVIGIVNILTLLTKFIALIMAVNAKCKEWGQAFIDILISIGEYILSIPKKLGEALTALKDMLADFFGSGLGKLWGGFKNFFGISEESAPEASAQSMVAGKQKGGNTVNTTTQMSVTNNISTRDNPQAIASAVSNTVENSSRRAGYISMQSQSGVMLKGAY